MLSITKSIVLQGLDGILIDVEVDISNLTEDTEFKTEIKKVAGIKSLSVDYVTVSLTLTDTSSDPVKFSVPLDPYNLMEGLNSNPIDDENGFITVEVQGASSVLSSIEKADIKVYVDLSDITEEGTYTRKIIVKGINI